MNPDLQRLHPYPFEKLKQLFAAVTPNPALTPISLGIGEPRHSAPEWVAGQLSEHLPMLANYPSTRGIPELRSSIANWLTQRFGLTSVDADTQVLPVNGTREALFAFTQAVIDRDKQPLVLSPNPFYQIYEGASLLAGAEIEFLNCTEGSGLQSDFDAVSDDTWQRCQLLFICTPGNPTGAVLSLERLQFLIEKAREFDFVIASDECYSEIYSDESQPPAGLLQACAASGLHDFDNCMVFHSLSKRSNLPGLRSGFVAGDARLIRGFLSYRTYHGCAMPLQHQWASISAWNDEQHVRENRRLYREKFTAVLNLLDGCLEVSAPQAGFYLWPKTPIDDRDFAQQLFANQHLTVLPGQFLGRDSDGVNPGQNRIRMALVATPDECLAAAERLRNFCQSL